LNDRELKALPAAKPGRWDKFLDAVVPGLVIRVNDRRTKTFWLVARFPGSRQNRKTGLPNLTRRALGKYNELTLEQARAKARAWLELIRQGRDPPRTVSVALISILWPASITSEAALHAREVLFAHSSAGRRHEQQCVHAIDRPEPSQLFLTAGPIFVDAADDQLAAQDRVVARSRQTGSVLEVLDQLPVTNGSEPVLFQRPPRSPRLSRPLL
jgi:hypothetical protein